MTWVTPVLKAPREILALLVHKVLPVLLVLLVRKELKAQPELLALRVQLELKALRDKKVLKEQAQLLLLAVDVSRVDSKILRVTLDTSQKDG